MVVEAPGQTSSLVPQGCYSIRSERIEVTLLTKWMCAGERVVSNELTTRETGSPWVLARGPTMANNLHLRPALEGWWSLSRSLP